MNGTLKKTFLSAMVVTLSGIAGPAIAQTNDSAQDDVDSSDGMEEIVVKGIRGALTNALVEKRTANNIKEVIQAEDIGKLPDQNLAEVLENVTGVQITRAAGVGTGVQIRGTGANRVEVNGVSTVSAGNGRSGISFEDLPASLIASVEVTKVPTAKTIEGSVGGTINLRTLRGLDLSERVLAFRAQAEDSDLSKATSPRFSGTFGDKWSTSAGDVGFVFSASYSEQDVTSFDPRFDRDREVLPGSGRLSEESFPFLRTQFLDQQLTNQEYETFNYTSSIEFAPNDELKFYFDATFNDQTRAQQSARAFFSGTGSNAVVDATTNTSFETVNLGSIDGPNGTLHLGEVDAVLTGVLGVGVLPNGGIDSNLRTSGQTSSRKTESSVFALGGEWARDRLEIRAEIAHSESDTVLPNLTTTTDFINPNGPQPVLGESVDNGVPAIFDASGRTLQFGIAPGLAETPTTAELLDPANYALRQVGQGVSTNDNSETAIKLEGLYDTSESMPFFSSIEAGLRWSESTAVNNDVGDSTNFTNATSAFFRPTGDLFSSILTPGPDNFNAADGRSLYVPNYLIVNPATAFNNPNQIIDTLNEAILASNALNGVDYATLDAPSTQLTAFFDIAETTTAAFVQGNFDFDAGNTPVRGNIGFRWVNTDIDSVGNNVVNDVVESLIVSKASYDFWLPRLNVVVEPTDNLLVRAGIARDLRRPDFDDLSTSVAFPGGASVAVRVGNPELEPETVWSYDLSAEYYFSDASFVSLGVFHKERTNLFAVDTEFPAEPTGSDGQIERDITPPCEEGGIFNPVADRNVWSSTQGVGICVPLASTFNVSGDTTQTGVEVAFQYDLSQFEDRLGWLAGFGFIGNYTYQDTGGSAREYRLANGDANALNDVLGRTDTDQSTPTLDDDVVQQLITLPNLSKNAYNMTLYYDMFDVSFRARYTWRSDFITNQFISFNTPRVVDDRAQLNASVSYAINDKFTVGIEGINLLREDRTQWCVNDNALLCSQGLTDRRIIVGVSGQF